MGKGDKESKRICYGEKEFRFGEEHAHIQKGKHKL